MSCPWTKLDFRSVHLFILDILIFVFFKRVNVNKIIYKLFCNVFLYNYNELVDVILNNV